MRTILFDRDELYIRSSAAEGRNAILVNGPQNLVASIGKVFGDRHGDDDVAETTRLNELDFHRGNFRQQFLFERPAGEISTCPGHRQMAWTVAPSTGTCDATTRMPLYQPAGTGAAGACRAVCLEL